MLVVRFALEISNGIHTKDLMDRALALSLNKAEGAPWRRMKSSKVLAMSESVFTGNVAVNRLVQPQ